MKIEPESVSWFISADGVARIEPDGGLSWLDHETELPNPLVQWLGQPYLILEGKVVSLEQALGPPLNSSDQQSQAEESHPA